MDRRLFLGGAATAAAVMTGSAPAVAAELGRYELAGTALTISEPIRLPRNGAVVGRRYGWMYGEPGSDESTVRLASDFAGEAAVVVEQASSGVTLAGFELRMGGQRNPDGSPIAGIVVRGAGMLHAEGVSVFRPFGIGVRFVRAVDGTAPTAARLRDVVVKHAGSAGWDVCLTDSDLHDCMGFATEAGPGWVLRHANNNRMVLRAEWNRGRGVWWPAGETNFRGGVTLEVKTDGNYGEGVWVEGLAGSGTLHLDAHLRRDCRSPAAVAGLVLLGNRVPVHAGGVVVDVGRDDRNGLPETPATGVWYRGNKAVAFDGGVVHGRSAGLVDAGGNTLVRRSPTLLTGIGLRDAPVYS